MKINPTFSIPCPKCGGTEFKYEEPLADDTFVECTQCGLALPLSDIKAHGLHVAKEHVVKEIQSQLKKDFKKLFK